MFIRRRCPQRLGAFFGVRLGGYVFDATRSYDLIWLVGIAWAFAAWTAPDSVFTFVSVLSFCQ